MQWLSPLKKKGLWLLLKKKLYPKFWRRKLSFGVPCWIESHQGKSKTTDEWIHRPKWSLLQWKNFEHLREISLWWKIKETEFNELKFIKEIGTDTSIDHISEAKVEELVKILDNKAIVVSISHQ